MAQIPTSVENSTREEWLLAEHLINNVTRRASGDLEFECHHNYPKDVFFIGNLRPREENEQSMAHSDLMQKLSPSAFGAEFKIKTEKKEINIDISLSWDCFYRAFPSYLQEIEWLRQLNTNVTDQNDQGADLANGEDNNDEEDDTLSHNRRDRQQERQPREDLFIRFKKISKAINGTIQLLQNEEGIWGIESSSLVNNSAVAIEEILTAIRADEERIRLRTAGQLFTIPQGALENEQAYQNFIGGLNIEADNNWSWQIVTDLYQTENDHNEIILLIQFVNATQYTQGNLSIEPYLFNTKADFKFMEDVVVPFELELAPKSFRYDRNMWGRGFNCGLEKNGTSYSTTHTPIFTQWRYKTREEPEAKFQDLTNDPIPILENIYQTMTEYLRQWDIQENLFQVQYGELWGQKYREEFIIDKSKFEEEILQFEEGLKLIKKDKDIRLAFILTNETFRRAGLDKNGKPKKIKWRLFQIVFMVTQIPSIAALNPLYKEQYKTDRDFVDIIYFPTGGGKTEAYLSILIFHCFYDRLRGKTAGVTSWIRFPLRLLTLQQTQRLADIIGVAELVRLEQQDERLTGKNIDPFSVGYFVGADSTPNKISVPQNGRPDPTWSLAQDINERQRWKRVVTCPSCRTKTVKVDFDHEKVKVLHRCSNRHCKFPNGIIPVYVIDNEIFRYLPSVMVGTIDKLAGIGNQRKLSLVFGKVDGICKIHGYFNSICCQDDCKDRSRLTSLPLKGLSGPTLFIQDELHLLKEGFGTFDSHYETFAQYLLKDNENELPIKIIASSATIEKYERQVEHLYGKKPQKARVFPGRGPTLRNSFYAQTEEYPQRIFIGMLPHNKTIFNAILEIIEYYHRLLRRLTELRNSQNPYGGLTEPGTYGWHEILDLYYSSLTYFLAGRDLDSIKTDIESHVNSVKFLNEGITPLQIKELTGSIGTDEVTEILEQLETPHTPDQPHESVLATNMVSHGVDIDRFNCMLFYGIPRQNAEYIQASSRVGRKHIGIVFCCFHPIRERDQSHYAYFNKYHEFLGQMVEPVAINRWSAYGIDKTLPGLFMGTVLQILSNREQNVNRNSYYMLEKVNQMYQNGQIDKNEIKTILKDAFKAGIPNDERNVVIENKINQAVDFYFDSISNPGTEAGFLSNALIPKPMRSLRDVDDPIIIELDRLGEQWGNTN